MTKKPKKRIRLDENDEKIQKTPEEAAYVYKPEYAKIARILCAQGATDDVLADAFNCCTSTIRNWRTTHIEFGKAVAEGKAEIFDPLVERSLAQRAIGYSVDTEEVKMTKDGDVVRIPTRKHFPPDTTACIFWLKNRQPEKWRDVHRIEHEGKIEGLTAEKLAEEIRRDLTELGLAGFEGIQNAAPNGKLKH